MRAGGYEGFEAESGNVTHRQFRALRGWRHPKTGCYDAPSDTPFFRVINRIGAAALDRHMGQWMRAQQLPVLQALASDGKCLRGRGRGDGKPLQRLSAVSHRLRLTVPRTPSWRKATKSRPWNPCCTNCPRGSCV